VMPAAPLLVARSLLWGIRVIVHDRYGRDRIMLNKIVSHLRD